MAKNISTQNSFIRGLITEATGLNFPENAATDTSNCVFTLIGDVERRLGIDYEKNYSLVNAGLGSVAVNSFRWINAGGDGETELLVIQVGSSLLFFKSSASTPASPLSSTLLPGNVNITAFQVQGNANNASLTECQFSTGNGYLFVYHPDCDPFYCTFSGGGVQANIITVKIRDFTGYYPEPGNPNISFRPSTLTSEHNYNLQNQGWTSAPVWTAVSSTNNFFVSPLTSTQNSIILNTGSVTFTVASGLSGVTNGQTVTLNWTITAAEYLNTITNSTAFSAAQGSATGTVSSYSGSTLVLNILTTNNPQVAPALRWLNASSKPVLRGDAVVQTTITPGISSNTIDTFKTDTGFYPSDSDIWYTFKDSTGVFNPTTMYGNVGVSTTPAPRGFYIYNAFNQNKSEQSGISGLTDLSTTVRPANGAWFQGRVWYAGVNGVQAPVGDQGFYTWSENIYFSQIINLGDTTSFGNCYQQNDPTDETFFSVLPTDGGVITIQGCGNIYKLFPIQNGLLVFADNGIWLISGSQGIGFTATDYIVSKLSSIKILSNCSIVDVLGLPYFWNEEGIYRIVSGKENIPYGHGGFIVEPITVGTILSFYNQIPLDSKVYARGDYDPINYVIKWTYRTQQESGIANRYQFDGVLNFNIYNRAFYPYQVSLLSGGVTPSVGGIFYMNYPTSLSAPEPSMKYISYINSFTFAEENDTSYVDWKTTSGQDYISFFTTGYSLHGKGVAKWQPTYIYLYSRNSSPWAYTINGVWDYAINPNSGRYSSTQTVINGLGQPNFGMNIRRHKIRGHGQVLQFTVSSVQGQPFDIMGWTTLDQIDVGV